MAGAVTVRVTELLTYPVKSFGGVSLQESAVEPWGLRGDRRWAVVDGDGAKVTAREERSLLGLRAEPRAAGGVRLSGPGAEPLEVEAPHEARPTAVRFSGQATALPAGPEADAWVSAVLGRALRLVWQGEGSTRPIRPEMGGEPGELNSLSDAAPLHVTSESSLAQLGAWLAETADGNGEAPPRPMGHDRFRPNVVVAGGEPFAEDAWARVSIGEVAYRATMICDRCVMTTIERADLTGGKEPIRTLARHRRWDGATWFGVRLAPVLPLATDAVIRVGDLVVAES